MPASKTIPDPELGKIKLTKYKGAKNIRIKVKEDSRVSVSLPYFVSYDEAFSFLLSKREWIKEQRQQFDTKQRSTPTDLTKLRTRFRELEMIPCEITKATYRLSPTKIKIYYPSNDSGSLRRSFAAPQDDEHANNKSLAYNDELQATIKTALEAALRREAHSYLPQRLKELAEKHQLKYKGLAIRNTKTRWGSCSHENNINLCIHLMKLPDELIDYVILHELTHTVHKNHSPRFWAKLSELLGQNAKTIDKKLKKYRPDINLV